MVLTKKFYTNMWFRLEIMFVLAIIMNVRSYHRNFSCTSILNIELDIMLEKDKNISYLRRYPLYKAIQL